MLRRLLVAAAFALVPLVAQAQPTITWEMLAQVEFEQQGGRYSPAFASDLRRLDGQEVRLEGFMMPLEQAQQQQQFLLTPFPLADCFFCIPGGPESIVEVKLDRATEFSYDPIVVQGRLELLDSDPQGMLYRITAGRVR